jgi:hypothetical protein
MSKNNRSIAVSIAVVIILIAAGVAVWWLTNRQPTSTPDMAAESTTSATSSAAVSTINTTAGPQACTSRLAKVSIQIPQGWECLVQEDDVNQFAQLTASGNDIVIDIVAGAGAGAGDMCGNTEIAPDCVPSVFFENQLVKINLNYNKGEDYYMLGVFKQGGTKIVDITYPGMERNAPTAEQSGIIKQVLQSIKLL